MAKPHTITWVPHRRLPILAHGPHEAMWKGTDDFFMTSGFCIDVGLYDVITGLVDKKKLR